MRRAGSALIRTIALGACSTVAVAMLALPLAAVAESHSSRITVTATIPKHASLKILSQPSSLVVTAADVARGYVEVPAPAQIAVKNNSAGYMLVLSTQSEFVRQVRVRGLGPELQMGSEGLVSQPSTGSGMRSTTLDLGFRFELSADAHQGVYQWPVHFSVMPL